jgi:hypothetical protein
LTFSGSVFGGITAGLHVVLTSLNNNNFTVAKASPITATEASTDLITVTNITGFNVGNAVQFYQTTFGGLVEGTTYYILTSSTISGTQAQITVSLSPGGVRQTLSSGAGSCLMYGTTVDLSTDGGSGIGADVVSQVTVSNIGFDNTGVDTTFTGADTTGTVTTGVDTTGTTTTGVLNATTANVTTGNAQVWYATQLNSTTGNITTLGTGTGPNGTGVSVHVVF